MTHKLFLCVLAAVFVVSCSSQDNESPATASPSFDSVYATAVDAFAAAQSRGVAWTTSEALLQEAELANAEGRLDEAIDLATEAGVHAQLAVQQADREKEAWRGRIPRN